MLLIAFILVVISLSKLALILTTDRLEESVLTVTTNTSVNPNYLLVFARMLMITDGLVGLLCGLYILL